MPALLTYAWVTSLHLHRPGAIQHLSTWQRTKISVPGRQTGRAGSALPLAHLALLFHQESKIALLSCPASRDLCVPVFITGECFSKEPVSIVIPHLSANEQADLLVI